MSRAAGRKSNTPRQPVPGSPEGDEIGLSARQDPSGSPIPGLTGNIVNYEVVRQKPAAPLPEESFDEYRGMMAHGVPNDSDTTNQRALLEREGTLNPDRRTEPRLTVPQVRPAPIPVYVTQPEGGSEVFRTASPRSITVPNSASDAVRLGGRNPRRNRIGLLNEDTSTNVRIAQRPSDLINGGGALLAKSMASYVWLETQDELYAVTDSATLTVKLSIIEEFEQGL